MQRYCKKRLLGKIAGFINSILSLFVFVFEYGIVILKNYIKLSDLSSDKPTVNLSLSLFYELFYYVIPSR